MSGEFGHFTFYCCHTPGDAFGNARGPSCGAVATKHAYGMDRCDEHLADLDPASWPANQPTGKEASQ
jgi:hypothetical protein